MMCGSASWLLGHKYVRCVCVGAEVQELCVVHYYVDTIVSMGGVRSLECQPFEVGGAVGFGPFGVVRRKLVRLGPSPFVGGGRSACGAGRWSLFGRLFFIVCRGTRGTGISFSRANAIGVLCVVGCWEAVAFIVVVLPGRGYLFACNLAARCAQA